MSAGFSKKHNKSVAIAGGGSILLVLFDILVNVSGSFALKDIRWEHGEKPWRPRRCERPARGIPGILKTPSHCPPYRMGRRFWGRMQVRKPDLRHIYTREPPYIHFGYKRLRSPPPALSGQNRSSTMNSIASGLFRPSALLPMNSLVFALKAIFRGSLMVSNKKRMPKNLYQHNPIRPASITQGLS